MTTLTSLARAVAATEAGQRRVEFSTRPFGRSSVDLAVETAAVSGKVIMRGDIEGLMKASEDRVMVIDLGQSGDTGRFLFLGHHEKLSATSAVVI